MIKIQNVFFFDLSYIGYKAISYNLHMVYIIIYAYIKLYGSISFKKLILNFLLKIGCKTSPSRCGM